MQSAFLRTLRALESDHAGWEFVWLFVGIALATAWAGWAGFARLPMIARSDRARLEGVESVHAVQADEDGELLETFLQPGAAVQAGDTLVRFDDRSERATLAELTARRAAAERGRITLLERLRVLEARTKLTPALDRSDTSESNARVVEAETRAVRAEADARRSRELEVRGLVSPAEVQRLDAEARGERAAADALDAARSRTGANLMMRQLDVLSDRAAAQRDLAGLDAEIDALRGAADRARWMLARRTIVAPVAGRVVRIAEATPGSHAEAGDTLAWIVPAGSLRAVAEYSPGQAVGFIQPGQRAWVRPANANVLRGEVGWPARVASLSPEPRSGWVRVESALNVAGSEAGSRAYGLPVVVEIEVGRATPIEQMVGVAAHGVARWMPRID